ncbi:major facilitator superfamily (MFS) transporter [Candidatus Koribacter versatilis Ellin345]|uniref:Major facilitator superfamily (MFS) transporter n=1 Tax=Koribacter versatilis (strain Ellin345) TaxID=204669 RepID=Q1INJ0_KORVE|nr:MFS transporter [Candidatus Koribacter versatilis]ABF41560.1 major facilitator superfamily (MFS) transporter [Candidatus Koribacter versatilis Ellin345]
MDTAPGSASGLTTSQRTHAVLAGYLGWTMDAFDFFVVVFMLGTLAEAFAVKKSEIVFTMTITLAMRPVGAFLFGLLADRFGRRVPFMANVIYFSLIEVLCGFAPNYKVFLLLRALYGIGMGGEWGIGASLAMESIPQRLRGMVSGVLQSGYSAGYLLAALAYRFVFPGLGWRWMFWIGGIPAVLALYIRWHVPESDAWKEHAANKVSDIMRVFAGYWKSFAYLLVMMTLFMFLSHGTQDLYPDFLKTEHNLSAAWVSYIAIIYNIGAIVGAIIFGLISQRMGRRKGIVFALFLSFLTIPAWAFGHGLVVVAAAAFLMQVGVQGAWGVVPVHLNELAPDAARGLVPGFAYQLGILFASGTNNIEYALRDHFGYRWALAGFEIFTIISLAIVVWFGREAHGKQFSKLST